MNQLRESESSASSLVQIEYEPFGTVPSELSMGDLLPILKKHRTVFFSVFFFVMSLGALYIFGSHKKYTSMMELMVQNERSEPVISAGRQEAPASTMEASDQELGSEVELVQSADVLNEVVDPGWSAIPNDQHPAASLQKHEKAVDGLRSNLVVAPVKLSHVFTVQLTTRSPFDSNHQLNRLLDAFLSEKRRISHPSGASAMFAQQAELYRTQWETAQNQLSRFQQNNQLVSVNMQQELLEKEILSNDSQLRDTDVMIAEAKKKMLGDETQISVLPSRVSTRETAIPASGSIDQMYSRLSELKVQRTELLAKYRPEDRLVKEVEDKMADIQASLDDSRTLHSSETTTDVNPTWQLAQQDLSETSIKLTGLVGRQKALQAQLDELQGRLSSVTQGTQSFSALQQKVAELEANYQLYAQKRDEAKMAEVMDEHQLLNVAVIQAPTFSPNPVSPRPVLDSLMTIVTAIFLACLAVFIVHNGRSTVDTERELQAVSRYPTLASVPTRKILSGKQEMA